MNRINGCRYALFLLVLAAAVVPHSTSWATGRVTDRRPNVIFIMADDLGWNELGCYGQEKIETPHINRLATEGMRFTDYYQWRTGLRPARCTLLTGKHLGHAYVRDNFAVTPGKWDQFGGQLPLPPDTPTIASLLQRAGYTTGAFGKWGLGGVGSSGDPLQLGFDRFFGYNCQGHAHNFYPRYLVDNDGRCELEGNDRGLTGKHYAPERIADELLEFIRANKDQPMLVYYASILPHLALQVPEEELARYRGQWPETPYTGRAYLPHPTPALPMPR